MANIRRYIGARYTIKINENSQDAGSAEWEANTSYEPLVMVTYNNSSYLSKKDVPATIGNPAQNPLYWIVTGAYNGQIAALQAQIDAINNTDIPNIESAVQTLTNTVGDSASGLVKDVADNTTAITVLNDFKTMLDGYTARSATNRVILEVEADGVKLLGALMAEAYNQFAAYFSTTNAKVIKLFNIVVGGVATFVSRENGEYVVADGAPGGCNVYNFDPQQDGSVIMYNANFKASGNIINVTTLNIDGTITTSPKNLTVPTAGQKIRFIMYEYL